MTLAQHSPHAFRRLYQTRPESRLYALLPPIAERITAGSPFELQLTLFGHGVDHALAVTQAIADLGRVGLRPGGYFELVSASTLTPQGKIAFVSGTEGFLELPRPYRVMDYLQQPPQKCDACHVHFRTPLRIKNGNDLLRIAPTAAQLIKRIFSRIDQLSYAAGEVTPLSKEQRGEIHQAADEVRMTKAEIELHGITRRSGRSGQQMQFNGLVGNVDYTGELASVLPWLRLAQLTQVGGKTAFGFGGLEINASSPV